MAKSDPNSGKTQDTAMKLAAQSAQLFLPGNGQSPLTLGDVYRTTDIRFNVPQTIRTHLARALEEQVITGLNLESCYLPNPSGYSIPFEYEMVLQYLHEKGVIREAKIVSFPVPNDIPKFFTTRVACASVAQVTDGNQPSDNYAYGLGQTAAPAVSTMLGELLERYALLVYRNKALVTASTADLKKKKRLFVDPTILAGVSAVQKKERPEFLWDEKSMFRWVEGRSLTRDRKALIPAQLVFWNYNFAEHEPRLQQPITNGAAGYFTQDGAILRGLYELIERDAFFCHWLVGNAPLRIKPDTIPESKLQRLFKQFARYKLSFEILDTTQDLGVASAVVVIHDDSKGMPAIAVGGSAHHDPYQAIEDALLEAWSMYFWLRRRFPEQQFSLPQNYVPFSADVDRKERLLLWANQGMRASFNFFLNGPEVHFSSSAMCASVQNERNDISEAERLRSLVKHFEEKGDAYEIFFYHAHNPVVQALGFHAVKVVVPALVPLYLKEQFAPLGSERLTTVVKNTQNKDWATQQPHPFP